MEYVKLLLDASRGGWTCSGCGLFTNWLGKPVFGDELWTTKTKSLHFLENKPAYVYCPKCGKPLEEQKHE